MDKVLSARVDVKVVDELERACRVLRVTKKRFLEEAIQGRVRQIAPETLPGGRLDFLERSFGAWKRTPDRTAASIRKVMEETYRRHHRNHDAKS